MPPPRTIVSVAILVAAALAPAGQASGQVTRTLGTRTVRQPVVVAAIAASPFGGYAVAGDIRLDLAFTDVAYRRTDPTGLHAVEMHGVLTPNPTRSSLVVGATGLVDAPYRLRVAFARVWPAASVSLRQVGGAGVAGTCALAEDPDYGSGTQECVLPTLLQGGGTLRFEVIAETGSSLIPSLVTLEQLSQ